MSTLQAIKFRHLESQLNGAEKIRFLTKLIKQSNNFIADALFSYFMQSPNCKAENQIVNDILCKIIASREKKAKSIFKIDRIPNQLIGNIASYMHQKDYINFSQTNRSVYLGCNNPNLLQELDLLNVRDYSSVNLPLYRSVKSFKFKLAKFKELKFPLNGISVLNRLQTLEINGSNITNSGIDEAFPSVKKHISTDEISTLRLDHFANFGIEQFYSILSLFSKVECLNLTRMLLNDTVDPNKMYPSLRRLGVALAPKAAMAGLIEHYHESLTHLMVASCSADFQKMNFTKLQSLDIPYVSFDNFHDILKTAANVEKIQLNFHKWPTSDPKSRMNIERAVMGPIESCKLLSVLDLSVERSNNKRQLVSILQGLERGLFATRKWQRKKMKILIRNLSIGAISRIIYKTANVINWLQYIDDFMFIFSVDKPAVCSVELLNPLKRELQDISTSIKVCSYKGLLVMTKESCHINGFQSHLIDYPRRI